MRFGERCDFFCIAANQNRIGHDFVAIGQLHAALRANRTNGANQMLIHAHAPGDAVHDDAKFLCCHDVSC